MQWLLFIHSVPSNPDYLRVKLRRRLALLGAVPLKGAVYALPHHGGCLENFAGLRLDLLQDGGDAIICSAALISGMTDDAIIAACNQDRSRHYSDIVTLAGAARTRGSAGIRKLKRMMREVIETDYFNAPGRSEAEEVIRELEVRLHSRSQGTL